MKKVESFVVCGKASAKGEPCTIFAQLFTRFLILATMSRPRNCKHFHRILIWLSNKFCRGISPRIGDSPPRQWDPPGSPSIRVLLGASWLTLSNDREVPLLEGEGMKKWKVFFVCGKALADGEPCTIFAQLLTSFLILARNLGLATACTSTTHCYSYQINFAGVFHPG